MSRKTRLSYSIFLIQNLQYKLSESTDKMSKYYNINEIKFILRYKISLTLNQIKKLLMKWDEQLIGNDIDYYVTPASNGT